MNTVNIPSTLQRNEGEGSVNINDLPTGEYRLTVYDQFGDISPAYRQHQLIQLVTHIEPAATVSKSLLLLVNSNSTGNNGPLNHAWIHECTNLKDVYFAYFIP